MPKIMETQFDNGQFGTLPAMVFSRAAATVNDAGAVVASGAPRYAAANKLIVETPNWTTDISYSENIDPFDAGYDATGTEMWCGYVAQSGITFKTHRETTYPTVAASFSMIRADDSQADFLAAMPLLIKPNTRYYPKMLRIRFGLWVMVCSRFVDLNSNPANRNYQEQGISVFVSQNNGVTWAFVIDTNDTSDPTGTAAANGAARGRDWAITIAPETATPGQQWLSVLVSIVDYINDAVLGKIGGQAFLFRATRAAVGGAWTVEKMRKTFEMSGATETHFHCAIAFRTSNTIYQYISIGDSLGQACIREVTLTDANNYTTSGLSTRTVNGGNTLLGDPLRRGNQGLGFDVGQDNNSFLMGGDNTSGFVYRVTRPVDASSPVVISKVFGNPTSGSTSTFRNLYDCFYLRCGDPVNRRNYSGAFDPISTFTAGIANPASRLIFSRDGAAWAAVRRYTADSGWSVPFGKRMLANRANAVGPGLISTRLPITQGRRPLKIASGGTNYTLSTQTAIEVQSGCTVTTGTRDGSNLVVDPTTGLAFAVQPPALGPVTRLQSTGSVVKICRVRYNTANVVPQGKVLARLWIKTLIPGAMLSMRLQINGNDGVHSSVFGANIDYLVDSSDWEPITLEADLSAIIDPTFKPDIQFGNNLVGGTIDCVVVLDYITAIGSGGHHYPMQVNAVAPDELATISLPGTAPCTVAVTMIVPRDNTDTDYLTSHMTQAPLFCLKEDANNYVTLWADFANRTIKAEVVDGGSTLGTPSAAAWLVRDDQVSIVVNITSTGVDFSGVTGGGDSFSATLAAANTITPSIMLLASNHSQSIIGAMDFVSIKWSPDMTGTQRTRMLGNASAWSTARQGRIVQIGTT